MIISFTKYQGTGNDFVMINNLSGEYDMLSDETIVRLCDRRFGIGADGLIKINAKEGYDFEVDYYNSDASKSFCGNGARCAVNFAHELGITKNTVLFWAIDGDHEAEKKDGIVYLNMKPVSSIEIDESFGQKDYVIHTGSPHFIRVSKAISYSKEEFVHKSKHIRYSDKFKKIGINVNEICLISAQNAEIRTYERGVEAETLSCGTGVTAAAIVMCFEAELIGNQSFELNTKGGLLRVNLNRTNEKSFESIFLIGPALKVFNGIWNE